MSSGDAVRGKATFAARCTTCHKDDNDDGYFGTNDGISGDTGVYKIDPDDLGSPSIYPSYNGASRDGLAAFIQQYMGPAAGCDAQCALDTATYIWSLKDGVKGPTAGVIACTNPNAIHYGKRTLHILSSYEYHNSLSQLFTLPLPDDYSSPAKFGLDVTIARLPNHVSETLNETRVNNFYDNAVEIADWAISSNALPFSCDDPIQCATDFINEFAYVAYRRALTEVEQADINLIFTEAPSLEDGLKWAIRTVLMSPNFLYRSELGTKVSDLLANPVVAPGTKYEFQGTPTTFRNLKIERYNRISVDNSGTYSYRWTGKDLIAISVKGAKSEFDRWPVLTIGAGYGDGGVLQRITVNHSGYRTYYIVVDKVPNGPIYFLNDANYAGNDYLMPPIEVATLSIGVQGEAKPVQDDVTKLRAADQNAYALDPYEYASALSFALTGSGPSKALLDAAVAGELVDLAKREAHVDALIDSPLGKKHIERLGGKWFSTDGLTEKTRNVAEFTPEVRQSMMQEIREIFKHVFYNGDFPSMYRGDFTYLDKTLSDFYKLPGGGSSHGDFRYVDTTGTPRGGVIASGAYMAYNAHMDYTSPIQRSAHFRQDVLCQAIPLPTNLEDSEERAAAAKMLEARLQAGDITTADWYDKQTNIPGSSCAACHNAIINPLFGIDDFDNVGRLRPRVNGKVVQDGLIAINGVPVPQGVRNLEITQVSEGYLYGYDAVGTLSGAKADAAKASGDGLRFSGAKELSRLVVDNDLPGVSACLIEKTTRYALGYTLNKVLLDPAENGYYGISNAQAAEFACVKQELEAAYAKNKSPRDVLKAVVMSDSFRFRK